MMEKEGKSMAKPKISVGVDVGSECIKVAVVDDQGLLQGSSIVARRGYFQDRVAEAFPVALDDAQVSADDVLGVCATGFAENCVPMATHFLGEMACHALGAAHFNPATRCVVDIGGRDPKVIQVNERGRPTSIQTLRRCATGIGTFLIFAARHLDVHPSHLQELAARTDESCEVGSYCSMFAGQTILERLREGVSREAVALGCINSIADRVIEIGGFTDPVMVTGGVAEYFPGVLSAIAEKTGLRVEAVPQPILVGAVGAALWVFQEKKIPLSKQGANQ
jgi:predicted CoA-substrate-specific enzyme activase